MARRAGNTSSMVVGFVAFIALVVSAVCFGLEALSKMGVNLGSITGALSLIGRGCLLASVLLSAHNYARTLAKGWYVLYWILAVISILGFFGIGFSFL